MVGDTFRLKRFFELSINMAIAEFKIKNDKSFLGIFWYILSPLLTFLLLFLIFEDRLGNNIPYYVGYLLLGIIMFNFFEKTTKESIDVVKNNEELIKSINFKLEALILSSLLKNLFSHFFEIVMTVIFFIIFSIPLQLFIIYPIILIFYSLFIYGCSLIISSVNGISMDLQNIWSFFMRLIWLGTPIFYSIENQLRLQIVNQFNPIFYFINVTRDIILYNQFNFTDTVIMILLSLLFFMVGKIIFYRFNKKASEMF